MKFPNSGLICHWAAYAYTAILLAGCGCRSTPVATNPAPANDRYPGRPTTPPATFQLFHQDDNTDILVTQPTVTDTELTALLWQLRDAAQTHTFNRLHLSQKFVDARHPSFFIHIYRGAKCATETYVKGPYPCGASSHVAADFILGSFHDPNAQQGFLIQANGSETPVWNSSAGH